MASETQVRQYLAHWLQLGKRVFIHNGKEALQPRSIIAGDRYSPEFEDCWRRVCASDAGDCYLEGSEQTIAELLSSEWDVDACSRCAMPVPIRKVGLPPDSCPCFDLPNWPDNELPQPRSPVSSQTLLSQIRDRLAETNDR